MIEIDGQSLSIPDVVAVAREGAEVPPLSSHVRERLERSASWLRGVIERDEETIYGVNTGYGPFARIRVGPGEARQLSNKVVLSCAAGVGEPAPREVVRAMMLIRANSLAKGFSAVRPDVPGALIEMLNRGVVPVVPCKGSLGASGDLAPQAHIAMVLLEEPDDVESGVSDSSGGDDGHASQAWFEGKLLSGGEAMARAGISRLRPEPKEGLALTNGTDFMVGTAALAVADAERVLDHAEIAAALSLEAMCAMSQAFHPAIHEASGQPGQIGVAARLRGLLEGSSLIDAVPHKVQDAYSLRCLPQVLGPVRDIVGFVKERVGTALNSASDNPLIFLDVVGEGAQALSGGNFHGEGPAMWLDILGIALAEAGSIAERRVFRLLTPELNDGLPSMLVRGGGLDSGLMVAQYTAAALASDNKTLAHPDSVDSIPSSANQEDHVSMGANAARHTREIVDNVRRIVAIELLTAAQAVDLRPEGPEKLAHGTQAAYRKIRERVAMLERDRELHTQIEALSALVASGEIAEEVRRAIG